jgi:hypothetical protein
LRARKGLLLSIDGLVCFNILLSIDGLVCFDTLLQVIVVLVTVRISATVQFISPRPAHFLLPLLARQTVERITREWWAWGYMPRRDARGDLACFYTLLQVIVSVRIAAAVPFIIPLPANFRLPLLVCHTLERVHPPTPMVPLVSLLRRGFLVTGLKIHKWVDR